MFKYLVFAYDSYYPCGGMDDCILVTNDINEAIEILEECCSDYKEIYFAEIDKNLSLEEVKEKVNYENSNRS